MPRDAISIIKDTENQAHHIVLDAEARAAQMIDETEHSCREFLSKEEAKATAEKENQIAILKKKSNALTQKSNALNQKSAEEFENSARERLDGAVKIILQEIYEQCQ